MTRDEVKARIEELLGSDKLTIRPVTTDQPNDGIFRGGDITLFGMPVIFDPSMPMDTVKIVNEIKITKLQCKMCPNTYWLTNLYRNTDLCKACAKKLEEIQKHNADNS